MECLESQDCFGCVGLRRKQYCILNMQYSKSDYLHLKEKIIAQMQARGEFGELFPMTFSPFAYNHSYAQQFFPLERREVMNFGSSWYDRSELDVRAACDASKLPDDAAATSESILVKSERSGRPFLISAYELKAHKRRQLPLPRVSYDERMMLRASSMFGATLYTRNCARSGNPIQTRIKPLSQKIVWDSEVWQKEFRA
jgi:hypothetical protein